MWVGGLVGWGLPGPYIPSSIGLPCLYPPSHTHPTHYIPHSQALADVWDAQEEALEAESAGSQGSKARRNSGNRRDSNKPFKPVLPVPPAEAGKGSEAGPAAEAAPTVEGTPADPSNDAETSNDTTAETNPEININTNTKPDTGTAGDSASMAQPIKTAEPERATAVGETTMGPDAASASTGVDSALQTADLEPAEAPQGAQTPPPQSSLPAPHSPRGSAQVSVPLPAFRSVSPSGPCLSVPHSSPRRITVPVQPTAPSEAWGPLVPAASGGGCGEAHHILGCTIRKVAGSALRARNVFSCFFLAILPQPPVLHPAPFL